MGVHDGHRERKREQFRRYGDEAFADHELLELLLYYAIPRVDTNPIAHRLLEHFGSLMNVLSAPDAELEKVSGLGSSSVGLIRLVAPLYRRARISASKNEVILDTVERIGLYCLDLLAAEPREVMYDICLDAKGRRLNTYRLSEGGPGGVTANARQIMENALACNAVMVVLSHNHPSGLALPSREDIASTEMLRTALDAVGVRLAEHIVVADGDFVSLHQQGYL